MNCYHLTYSKEAFNNPLFLLMNCLVIFKNTEFFREKLYCLRFATATLGINVEPLKENRILLLHFAQNIVEVSF